ncbi:MULTISPECIES: gephyrin-like molybdotransferase Glp [Brachybacterium]|uniref:Molybdopterin molybdenumtransferase n=1 Tax=Brachybacterium alimentarium TaxID=47845 RepID=A0A2A3YLU7_9MICO|nr:MULTISPECIES: gephyrin-like molybdotransferase Glp [Brachybacterium]PCC35065.1 molybdopterin molybdenumtransferase MoeA [Brachybacterium alimentarium]PCC40260.1 molybdopterin molybdenumtransferase MoeA [Brachybacterium alimentarium]RCS63667.1 molybdopterin molybdenumtransferase MoeA [Brachybacterium sp. JB7]RCS69492.1 molybdopterin molybdenumtransferase MoeA [Brachybacterium alimentarium]RCS83116.1 molybdopterin molybdenumtransferase MoeA [Brachybacterium alimentarium]
MTAAERIPLADHVADALALLAPVRSGEVLPLGALAVGRVARVDARSRVDVPGHDNSQMDGYAVCTAHLEAALTADGSAAMPRGPMIAAGDAPGTLHAGTARPIMTGAPIPQGADAVIPVEESAAGRFEPGRGGEPEGSENGTVTLAPVSRDPGRYVRRRGSDTHAGDTVLRAGQVLTPARIAHLAACGLADVEVESRLRVIVLSTGSEVAVPGASPVAGGVFDANGPGLSAALAAAGAEVVHCAAVPDDAAALLSRLRALVDSYDADLVVTSGGVSAGAFEVVRDAAGSAGVTMAFPKVAMQPGGPQGIGTLDLPARRVPWLAFPGNPVSALLSCELIARPALGAPPRTRLRLPVGVELPEPSPLALEQYRRARLLPSGRVRLVGGASSHLIGGLAAADALVIVPVGTDMVHDGDMLETVLIPGGDS